MPDQETKMKCNSPEKVTSQSETGVNNEAEQRTPRKQTGNPAFENGCPTSGRRGFINWISSSLKRFFSYIPKRYLFALLSSFAFFNVYAMRVILSVTMVAMVGKQYGSHSDNGTIACQELMAPLRGNSTITNAEKGEFDWDLNTQSWLHSSFFIGYVLTQLPGGVLAEKYGAKWLFGTGILITAIFTLFTSVAAHAGAPWLAAVRFIEGLGEGVTYPAMNALLGKWAPTLERSRLATAIYIGSPIGTVVALMLSGYICASDELGGWPTVFYLFGVLGCIWFIFWALFTYESPEQHPRISSEEIDYIRAGRDQKKRKGKTPWRAIFTSRPLWALAVAHFGFNWGFYTLLTELPTYLANILHFDLKQNGLLSATPYLCQAIFAFIASFIADRMRASGRFSITSIRKLMNSIAFFVPAILVGIVGYVGCFYEVIITLIMISVAFSGFMHSGFNVTHIDMSPDFAGILMGITNCIANVAGFLAPSYVGLIIKDGQTVRKWSYIFLTTSLMYFVTGMVYNLFGSAELQPWGVTPQPDSEDVEDQTHSNEKRAGRQTPANEEETESRTPSIAEE